MKAIRIPKEAEAFRFEGDTDEFKSWCNANKLEHTWAPYSGGGMIIAGDMGFIEIGGEHNWEQYPWIVLDGYLLKTYEDKRFRELYSFPTE